MAYNIILNGDIIAQRVALDNNQQEMITSLRHALTSEYGADLRMEEAAPLEIHHELPKEASKTIYDKPGQLMTALNRAERGMRRNEAFIVVFDSFQEFNGNPKRVYVKIIPLLMENTASVVGFKVIMEVGGMKYEYDYDLNHEGNFINGIQEFVIDKIKEKV